MSLHPRLLACVIYTPSAQTPEIARPNVFDSCLASKAEHARQYQGLT
jgi:hypothetical protein